VVGAVHLVRVVVVMQKYVDPTRWATIYQLEIGVKLTPLKCGEQKPQ